MTGQDALAQWRAKLAERSSDTAANFSMTAREFLAYAGIREMRELRFEHLETYRAWLAGRTQRIPIGQPLSLSTMAMYLRRVKLFLNFCADREWLSLRKEDMRDVLTARPGKESKPYEVLSEAEIPCVLAVASPRQRALLLLGLYAGLRINEIAHVRVGDIVDDRARGLRFVRVQRGKGNKDRDVPLAPDVCAELLAYCGTWHSDQPIFGLSRCYCRALIERAVHKAGIERRITPHSLRHTYAFRLAKAGVPLLAIKTMLGHSSLETTQRYLEHLTASEVAQYAPSMTPL